MKRIVKAPNTIIPEQDKVTDPPASEISVDRLLDDGLVVLYREIKQLMMLSARGKLEPADAKDLRDHLKLLFELKERERDSLRGISDEELAAKAKEALNER